LECPQCHRAKPEHQGDKELVCPQCSTHYPQHQGEADWDGITMLHGPIEEETRLISKTDPVSTHVYPPYLVERINHYARVGGWVLDVGAGLRRQTFPNLVCVEIFDYPSSDVRSTGDSLPFADNSFDYVISNAVLEHVPHPFRDASELLRVLKPGGEMHVMVPFLQPEHGYPHHYFNMTRSGLLQLFGDAIEVESHTLDHSNEPIFSLSWFLSVYLSCLPKQEHDNFLNMKVKDFVLIPPQEYLTKPIVTTLSNQGRWTLATGHTLMARKKPVSG
jgi:SAM-dependent methyltransferase